MIAVRKRARWPDPGRTLEAARRLDPEIARGLDLMEMAYLALNQPGRAEKLFRQAVARAPEEPESVLHPVRALMALEREEEAQAWLEKYRKIRPPAAPVLRKRLGMIGLATLDVRRQRERAIEPFRRQARHHPDLQLHLASLPLADGQTGEAQAELRPLLAFNVGAGTCEDAGKVLLSAGQRRPARPMFERAVEQRPLARLLGSRDPDLDCGEARLKAAPLGLNLPNASAAQIRSNCSSPCVRCSRTNASGMDRGSEAASLLGHGRRRKKLLLLRH